MSQLSFDVIKRVWPKSGLTTFLKSTPVTPGRSLVYNKIVRYYSFCNVSVFVTQWAYMVHRVGLNNGQSAFQGLWLFRHGASGSLVFCRGHLAGCNRVLNQFQQHWEHSVTDVSSNVTSNLVIALLSVSPHTDPIFDIERLDNAARLMWNYRLSNVLDFISMGTPPNCTYMTLHV